MKLTKNLKGFISAVTAVTTCLIAIGFSSCVNRSPIVQVHASKLIGYTLTPNLDACAGYIWYNRFTAEGTGNVVIISVYAQVKGNVKVAIYADNSGSPGSLLNANNVSTAVYGMRWNNISIHPTHITSGTVYWLAIKNDTLGCASHVAVTGYLTRYNTAPYIDAFPAFASSPNYLVDCIFGIISYASHVAAPGYLTRYNTGPHSDAFPAFASSPTHMADYVFGIAGYSDIPAPPPPPQHAIDFYGDSITMGHEASNIGTNDWATIVANTLNYSKANHGINFAELADMVNTVYSTTRASYSISMALLGYNDMRHVGMNIDGQTGFQKELYSIATKLAIPSDKILWGNDSSIHYAGTWSDIDLGWGNHTKYSNANGSTATVSLIGSIIYIDILQYSGYTRGINVNIDGVDKGTFNGSNFVVAISGKAYAPYLLRFSGLINTSHTVVLTVTDGTGYAYVNWFASLNGRIQTNYPQAYIGNTLRMNAAGYNFDYRWNNGSDEAVAAFNNKISEVVTNLASDGLNVKYVNANSAYDISTDVAFGNGHPNNSGHNHIATQFLNSIIEYWLSILKLY